MVFSSRCAGERHVHFQFPQAPEIHLVGFKGHDLVHIAYDFRYCPPFSKAFMLTSFLPGSHLFPFIPFQHENDCRIAHGSLISTFCHLFLFVKVASLSHGNAVK